MSELQGRGRSRPKIHFLIVSDLQFTRFLIYEKMVLPLQVLQSHDPLPPPKGSSRFDS